MQHGPQKPDQSQRQHTPFSKFFGAASGALGEQLIFHPVDTVAKNGMTHKQGALPWLRTLVAERGVAGSFSQLYGGLGVALFKKGPMRIYKYTVQDALNDSLKAKYGVMASNHFGNYGLVLIQCAAGGATGLIEPLFFQAIDTVQIRKQVLKEAVSWGSARALGVQGLYRGAIFTGLARNVPGSVGLFGGSALANQLMNNTYESKDRSQLLNLAAKWFGALSSLVLSQPGDVIKTNMQVKQVPLRKAIEGITAKQLFTGGLGPRLFMSFKVGVGFFLIEECMNYSRLLFGKDSEEPPVAPPHSAISVADSSSVATPSLLTQYETHKSSNRVEINDEVTFGAYDDPLMNDLAKQLKKCRV